MPAPYRRPAGHWPASVVRAMSQTTPRDRLLLDWLHDHQVLTTPQITEALFTNQDTCARRLRKLFQYGLTDRGRWYRPEGGSDPYCHVVGVRGARLVAADRGHRPPSNAEARLRIERILGSRQLGHRLGANGIFTALIHHARTHPGTTLTNWLSPAAADTLYSDGSNAPMRCDGYGIWHENGRTTALVLEYDTGTEPIAQLLRKVDAYSAAATSGRWPAHTVAFVLASVDAATRETHLHTALERHTAGAPSDGQWPYGTAHATSYGRTGAAVPIATTTTARLREFGVAGASWLLAADPTRYRHLIDLPVDAAHIPEPDPYLVIGDTSGDAILAIPAKRASTRGASKASAAERPKKAQVKP